MASINKRGDWYHLVFHDSTRYPQRRRVALKTKRLGEAKIKAREIERDYQRGRFDPWELSASGENLHDSIRLFLRTRGNLTLQTQAKYKSVLSNLERFAGGLRRTSSVDTNCLQAFLDSTPKAAITKRTYSTTLSPFFNWLIKRGTLSKNPVKELRLPRVPLKAPRYLTPQDVCLIVRHVRSSASKAKTTPGTGTWLIPIVEANVYLGLRAGEVVNLQWQDIQMNRGTIRIGGRAGFTTKYGGMRTLPIVDSVRSLLEGLPRSSQWVFPSYGQRQLNRLYLSRRFKHFAREAGLPEEVCFHSTRHTAASWLVMGGASLEAVRRYMGHSSVRVTERYAHLSPEAFSNQIEAAFSRA